MLVLWATLALAGGLPGAELQWKRDDARLWIQAPRGEHVDPTAPVSAELRFDERRVVLEGLGADAERGLPLLDMRGTDIRGELSVPLCADGGTQCRIQIVRVTGEVPDAKKGRVSLAVREGRLEPRVWDTVGSVLTGAEAHPEDACYHVVAGSLLADAGHLDEAWGSLVTALGLTCGAERVRVGLAGLTLLDGVDPARRQDLAVSALVDAPCDEARLADATAALLQEAGAE